MGDLIPRGVEPLMRELAGALRIVIVNGPRQSGKTTLLRQAQSAGGGEYVSLDDAEVLRAARADPLGFVQGLGRPSYVDEVQRGGDDLVRSIKIAVDASRDKGQFILSGSSRFLTIPHLSESLAGRAGFVDLWTISVAERTGGPGAFLEVVAEAPETFAGCLSPWRRDDYWESIVRGGYPEVLGMSSSLGRWGWFDGYLSTVILRDISDFAQIHQADSLIRLLKLVAARSGSTAVLADLARDAELSRDTVRNYLSYLNMVFLTVDLPVWAANLTTRAAKAPRAFLSDSGLAAYLLGIDSARLRTPTGGQAAGSLLETFVLGELMKLKAMTLSRVSIMHYRDNNGREVDFILEFPAGDIVAMEVKASASPGASAAKHLIWLRDKLGERFKAGIVLHLGERGLSMGDRIYSLPLSVLWGNAGP